MLNTVILMGRLAQEPEMKTTTNGKSYLKFTIAVSQDKVSSDGERKVNFIDCLAWEKSAELICNYFSKGDLIIIEGRIETGTYKDKQGNDKKSFVVVVKSINFTSSKNNSNTKKRIDEKNKEENQVNLLDNQDLPF